MTGQGQPASADEHNGSAVREAGAYAPFPYGADDFRKEIKRVKRKRRLIAIICILVALVIAAVVASLVIFKVPSSLLTVDSDDMKPVLEKGQVAYVQQIDKPADNDVIAYRDASGTTQVKRVVALAGEWVNIASDGTALVSPVTMEGATTAELVGGKTSIIASRQVPDNSCFVIADADTSALEALYQSDSYVSYSQIVGKVANRVWPLTVIGPVS